MQGRDGEPPEVVRVCCRAGGEDGVFAGDCNGGGRHWSQQEEIRRRKFIGEREREKRCNYHVRWFDGFLWWR